MKKTLFLFTVIFLSTFLFSVNLTFIYSGKGEDIRIISSVNGYEPVSMEKAVSGLWKYTADVEEGKYFYKYIIDGEVTLDFNNYEIDYVSGEPFNVRYAYDTYYASKNDGEIKNIYMANERKYINPVKSGEIYLSVGFEKNDINDCNIQGNFEYADKDVLELSDMILYRFHVKTPAKILRYRFEIDDGIKIIYGYNGTDEFFEFNFDKPSVNYFDIPDWSKGIVYYQIFPERFQNGDKSNDPENTNSWYGNYTRDQLLSGYFGGDLQGVIDEIDYLTYLGIDAVYFNPIFEADSTHKYNTTDYMKIDDNFGTAETFQNLTDVFHKNNIKIILDGVFNHTGTDFFAMQENFKKQEKSHYLDWYYIKSFPVKESVESYKGWFNYASLPQLNNDNPKVKGYIGNVIGKWMSEGIDGWRLDAVDQLSEKYWSEFIHNNIKSIDENSLIVGEFWRDSTEYFEYPAFDSVMNYLFRDAVLAFAAGGSAKSFENSTNAYLDKYPPQVLDGLWNILDSHDTDRAVTNLKGDYEKFKKAVAIQMTFKGSPVIYYGDEIGMEGEDDPFCRKPFLWDQSYWNEDLFNFYTDMIALRKEYSSVRTGKYKVLSSKIGTLIYKRYDEKSEIIVAVNSKSIKTKIGIELDGEYTDFFTGEKYDKIDYVNGDEILVLIKNAG
ncbi:MAG TPA: glycoside hydrolase family 13 protein [Tepiditoga sp.]|nr:glycoside hydrolase family 13 protein [Tepiditoga sp.]